MVNGGSKAFASEVRLPGPNNLLHQSLGLTARNGYPAWVFDRDLLLGNLHRHLSNKEKLLLEKRVQKLEQFHDSVKVICRDGTEYTGHVVVGCDGVNSIVRKEMWRLSDLEEPGRISQEEKECQYARLYLENGTSGS